MRLPALLLIVAIVLTGCTEKGPALQRCAYEADIATSSLTDVYARASRRADLIQQCMALKGLYPKPEAFTVLGLDTVNPSTWEDSSDQFLSRHHFTFHIDWGLIGAAFGMVVWLGIVAGLGSFGYGLFIRRYPGFNALIMGRPPWDQRARLLVRLPVMAAFALAVAVLFVAAMLATVLAVDFIGKIFSKVI